MALFIAGARGYVGKPLMKAATAAGVGYGTSSTGGDEYLKLQLENPEEFDYEIINSGDVVLITSAISSPDVCASDYNYAKRVNVIGTSKFVENILLRNARVIFFSSDAVYGSQTSPFDEKCKCSHVGEYAQMKHEVEMKFYNSPLFKSIRLSYVFSKNDKYTKYLSSCVKNSNVAEVFDPFFRSVIYLDDVITGAINLALHWDDFPEGVINFGGPEVLSKVDIVRAFKELVYPELKFDIVTPSPDFFKNRPENISMSSPILSRLLGRPATCLHEAILKEFI